MTYHIPLEVYENFEEVVGKAKAKIIVKSLETSIQETFVDNNEITKEEIQKELKQELATKSDLALTTTELKNEINLVRKEIDLVRKEIELLKKDSKIQTTIIIAVIILLNQNSLEFIAKLLGIMK